MPTVWQGKHEIHCIFSIFYFIVSIMLASKLQKSIRCNVVCTSSFALVWYFSLRVTHNERRKKKS